MTIETFFSPQKQRVYSVVHPFATCSSTRAFVAYLTFLLAELIYYANCSYTLYCAAPATTVNVKLLKVEFFKRMTAASLLRPIFGEGTRK